MNKVDVKKYKLRLLELRQRLRGDVTSMADVALGSENSESTSMPIHMAELGSENFEQEFTLSLMASEEGTLNLIEGALVRIENGRYATCTECENKIPKTRLNAIPYAPLCFKCAESGESSTNGHRFTDHGANGSTKRGKQTGSSRRVNRPR
ncbi:MAG: TraR/DksA C4-type zinc finger protein [Pirellulales bacterium]